MCRKLIYLVSLTMVLSVALSNIADAAAPDPNVAWWKLDEGSGGTASDSTGNGHVGTISGAEWASPGWDGTGYCLDFDGVGTDRVSVGTFDVVGGGITIACWFKADNLDTPGNDPRMVSKAIGGSNDEHWWMVSSSRQGGIKILRFRLKTDGITDEPKAYPQGTIELNVWIHVAVTWDGSTMRIYKNAVEVGSVAKGGTAVATGPTVGVAIGNQPAGTGDRPFDGLIDDVRVYDYGLSQAEIQDLVTPPPFTAYDPDPANGASDVSIFDADICWTPGEDAVSHEVYFGTDPSPPYADTLSLEQQCYQPGDQTPGIAGDLTPDMTYYWQIVEVNEDNLDSPWPGEIWSFTTETGKARLVAPDDGSLIPGTPVGTNIAVLLRFTPGPTVDSNEVFFSDDLAKVTARDPGVSLGESYGFGKAYVGHPDPKYGPYTDSLVRGTTYYWCVDTNDVTGHVYPGDVWSFTTQGLASNPSPADGAIFVDHDDTNLTWTGDVTAVSYDIYLGTSESAVASASRLAGDLNGDGPVNYLDLKIFSEQWLSSPGNPSAESDGDDNINFGDYAIFANDWLQPPDPVFKGNQAGTTFNPGTMDVNTTYYWRVDGVNGAELGSPWKGNLWSFTTYDPNAKPRVIVSTDIGGSDNDDFQSMVHYLVYADLFDTEGLISSPPYAGRKSDILAVIDQYEVDYNNLSSHSPDFPTPQELRDVTKQGAIDASPAQGYSSPTEGSNWIISCANSSDPRPLWILVWGSITDVAQAVHDDPSIKSNIRVYSIGSWNTAQDQNARNYLYQNHTDLWCIEADTTFRGMYVGGNQSGDLGNWTFVEQHVRHHGALGDFYYSKKPDIKMGDTPSVLYLLWGEPDRPATEHWGGMFGATGHGPSYWTDLTDPQYREGSYDGAKTVNVWRESYLRDWQVRMDWANVADSPPPP